jgi:hypothetical protein
MGVPVLWLIIADCCGGSCGVNARFRAKKSKRKISLKSLFFYYSLKSRDLSNKSMPYPLAVKTFICVEIEDRIKFVLFFLRIKTTHRLK